MFMLELVIEFVEGCSRNGNIFSKVEKKTFPMKF